jgi:hypothetical protein
MTVEGVSYDSGTHMIVDGSHVIAQDSDMTSEKTVSRDSHMTAVETHT